MISIHSCHIEDTRGHILAERERAKEKKSKGGGPRLVRIERPN